MRSAALRASEDDPFRAERARRSTSHQARHALQILTALHRYSETGEGRVKPLGGVFEGLLRLRVGNHRVIFDETEDTITVHRVRDRREAYR